ncbi:MAG: PD-(D/E)XK nuclease family protein, partial [Gammaproteobacteria bacterium]|nr:PD-(D/E)XK nuclease family protein [Gammaproteobacteria bacterium]
TENNDDTLIYQFGEAAEIKNRPVAEAPPEETEIDQRLKQKIPPMPLAEKIIAPSYTAKEAALHIGGDEDAQLRGIVIHRCLELLTRECPFEDASVKQLLASECGHLADEQKLDDWLSEAKTIIQHAELKMVFQPAAGTKIHNELPIQYRLGEQIVYGVIDRLLVTDKDVLLIDYKTHQQASKDNIEQLAETYKEQMQLYANGIKQIWPDKNLQTALLFTSCHQLYYLN